MSGTSNTENMDEGNTVEKQFPEDIPQNEQVSESDAQKKTLRRSFVKIGFMSSVAKRGIQAGVLPVNIYEPSVALSHSGPYGSSLIARSFSSSSSSSSSLRVAPSATTSSSSLHSSVPTASTKCSKCLRESRKKRVGHILSVMPGNRVTLKHSRTRRDPFYDTEEYGKVVLRVVDSIQRRARFANSLLQYKVERLEAQIMRTRHNMHVRKRQRPVNTITYETKKDSDGKKKDKDKNNDKPDDANSGDNSNKEK